MSYWQLDGFEKIKEFLSDATVHNDMDLIFQISERKKLLWAFKELVNILKYVEWLFGDWELVVTAEWNIAINNQLQVIKNFHEYRNATELYESIIYLKERVVNSDEVGERIHTIPNHL